MPRAKQRTAELRDRILHAALAALSGEGVEALTARRVARDAHTSIPAVYELFGDKAGLIREIYYDGFRRLRDRLDAVRATADPLDDVRALVRTMRRFAREEPTLIVVMFARPYNDFDPGTDERAVGDATRSAITGPIQRAITAGRLHGNATDLAHVLLATCQGLALQETAGWLGTTQSSRDRRWNLATELIIAGASPTSASPVR